jgi:GT2 family glycosyltransferase
VRVVAIVVNWNGGAQTLRCLESLLAQEPPLAKVILVDNASSDGSCEQIRRELPQVEVLQSGGNLGYSGGNNLGSRRARELGAEAVLIANNDVTFEDSCVEGLVYALRDDATLAAVGPRVLFSDEPRRVWAAGGMLTWRQNLSDLRGFGELDGEQFRRTVAVDYVPGCAVLLRVSALDSRDVFDDRYFAYTEDVDLGMRLRRAGHGLACIGAQRAWHAPSSSTGGGYNPRRKYMMGVNSVHFLRTWGGAREWLRFWVYDVLTLPLLIVDGFCRGNSKAPLAKALGIFHGLQGRHVGPETVKSGATPVW